MKGEKRKELTFNNSGGMNVKATQAAISSPHTTALMAIRCQMEGREEEKDFAILTGEILSIISTCIDII